MKQQQLCVMSSFFCTAKNIKGISRLFNTLRTGDADLRF